MAEIKEQGADTLVGGLLPAPRVTPEQIQSVIGNVAYYVFPATTLTVCCIVLKNGFCVTGESACVSPESFDAGVGEKIAFDNAVEKIWALEGYALRERINGQLTQDAFPNGRIGHKPM